MKKDSTPMCGPEQDGQIAPIQRDAPLILAASPREGNSLLAALEFCRGLDDAQNAQNARVQDRHTKSPRPAKQKATAQIDPVQLRHYRVLPCMDCGACARAARHVSPDEFLTDPASLCPLADQDDSRPLLNALATAPLAAFCSPIYFYHLPAQLKALLDRCQIFYRAAENPALAPLLPMPSQRQLLPMPSQRQLLPMPQTRPFFPLLLGARSKGDKLFEGSLLSLKYALAPLGFMLQPPLLLYGLDQKADLAARPAALEAIRAYGRQAKY